MIKIIFKVLVKFILYFVAFAGVYLLAAVLLPYVTVNRSFKKAPEGLKVFVLPNGVHSDLVVPAVSAYKNWQTDFPQQDFKLNDPVYAYIGFGWGTKAFT